MERPARDSGTTLIELVLVVALMGVLGALGTTQLVEYRTAADQRSLAQDAVSLVRTAATSAVSRSLSHCVRFTTTSAVAYRGACGTGTLVGRVDAPRRSRFDAPSFAGGSDVVLRPRGTATGGTVSVVRGDGKSPTLVVRVEALTSRVSYA